MTAEPERSYIIVFLDNEIALVPFVKYNAIIETRFSINKTGICVL